MRCAPVLFLGILIAVTGCLTGPPKPDPVKYVEQVRRAKAFRVTEVLTGPAGAKLVSVKPAVTQILKLVGKEVKDDCAECMELRFVLKAAGVTGTYQRLSPPERYTGCRYDGRMTLRPGEDPAYDVPVIGYSGPKQVVSFHTRDAFSRESETDFERCVYSSSRRAPSPVAALSNMLADVYGEKFVGNLLVEKNYDIRWIGLDITWERKYKGVSEQLATLVDPKVPSDRWWGSNTAFNILTLWKIKSVQPRLIAYLAEYSYIPENAEKLLTEAASTCDANCIGPLKKLLAKRFPDSEFQHKKDQLAKLQAQAKPILTRLEKK